MHTHLTLHQIFLLLQIFVGRGTDGDQYDDLYVLRRGALAIDDDILTPAGTTLARTLGNTPGGREILTHLDVEADDDNLAWYL